MTFRSAGGMAVLAAGLVVGPAHAQGIASTAPTDTVSLESAVARALDVNSQMVQAREDLGTAEFGTRQAYAALLPSLSASSGASRSSSVRYDPNTDLRVTGQSTSYSAGISSGVTLFAGGRNLAAVRRARASANAADASLVTRRFAVTLAAKQAFFAVLRSQELIALDERRVEQAEGQLAAAERRMQAGQATRSDVLRARLELSNTRQGLLQSRTQHWTDMHSLGQTVGVHGPVAARAPESLAPEPLAMSTAAMRELVLGQAPTVRSAEAQVVVAEAGVSQARAQYLPTVSVSGGYNWSNSEFDLDQGMTSWSTRLNISYPLFNGLQREASVDQANAQLNVASAQAAETSRAALTQLESLIAALELAEGELAILEESVEVAREDYRVQQERYTLGAATILELVSSQIALGQAEYNLINARYDYQIARAELESLVGREL